MKNVRHSQYRKIVPGLIVIIFTIAADNTHPSAAKSYGPVYECPKTEKNLHM
jgi:hypothetical protein